MTGLATLERSWAGFEARGSFDHMNDLRMNNLALKDLRILDLTQVAVGPYTTFLLGFMGAEVIKVESTSRMDISRGQARPTPQGYRVYPDNDPGERPWNRAGHHIHRNPNKLSLTLDLSTERGKELLKKLATLCDVLIENFRASVMDRLGLGYEVLSQINPQLIYLKISSQGATGPEKDYGSLGSTLEQTAGLASVTGYEDRKPLMTNETYPDPVGGIFNVGVLLGTLRRRHKTGQGAFIDFSQREMTASMLGQEFLDFSFNARVAGPMGNRHPIFEPQGVYPCQGDDMWVAISVGSEEEWVGLCDAIDMPQLARNPRFETALARRRNRDELERFLTNWTREQDHYDVMHTLQKNGVPAGAVLKGGEIINDPHLEERGFWDEVHHPEAGFYKQVTTPWEFSKSGRIQTTPAPNLGEHNEYVLSDLLGMTSQELYELEEKGVIGTFPIGAE